MEGLSNHWDFLSSLAWPVTISLMLLLFFGNIGRVLTALANQLEKATELKLFGSLELKGPRVDPGAAEIEIEGNIVTKRKATEEEFNKRNNIYDSSRHLMLVHRIKPSTVPGQKFDISVFLSRKVRKGKQAAEFQEVEYVEYYFGEYFGRKPHGDVYTVKNSENGFAMTTSSYGGAICVATIRFKDGHVAIVSRFIDFEMQGAFKQL